MTGPVLTAPAANRGAIAQHVSSVLGDVAAQPGLLPDAATAASAKLELVFQPLFALQKDGANIEDARRPLANTYQALQDATRGTLRGSGDEIIQGLADALKAIHRL